MKYLGISENELQNIGGIHTAREIQQQPVVWQKIYDQVRKGAADIKRFLDEAIEEVDEIILTGAGISAYIGICLQGDFRNSFGVSTTAIPTTDLVTHPHHFFNKNKNVMLVSFTRSGCPSEIDEAFLTVCSVMPA
ncbi:MAG: hypothetical protein DRI89_02930 [Bacteroidetes bacterium]|nr:MAG: hypothetical protein DRI89_02930 [Bacteroidota bacterium]